MGNKIQKEVTAKRREVVASLLARGLRQSEIVDTLSQAKYAHEVLPNGEPNPHFIGNPVTGEPFNKATISRDVKHLMQVWRENAALDAEEHFARQLAELTELKRAAWSRKDISEIRQCLALEMKLLGTARPEKFEHDVNPELRGKLDKLAGLFQHMRDRETVNASTRRQGHDISKSLPVGSH